MISFNHQAYLNILPRFIILYQTHVLLKFAGEVEFNFFKVLLCHTEHIARVGKEYISPFNVFCHILVLALFETFECR